MSIAQGLTAELGYEVVGVRKTIERCPDSLFGYTPHAKSFTMGRLVGHLCEIPSWCVVTATTSELDFAPPGGEAWQPFAPATVAEALAKFDADVTAATAALAEVSDEAMFQPWSLKHGGQVILTMPKIQVFRGFVLSHLIHHRAQLGLYLRLNDLPVPSIYGPSADEGDM
ncbi:MAG: maleylpyruvate isomerase N-terminal domain-containing protein [Fimbriimonadaceae bacterium]|nr:maleylpyruvate isomerase N-terminal domain-containing protein [Fimbriimonadaceae bacterium]